VIVVDPSAEQVAAVVLVVGTAGYGKIASLLNDDDDPQEQVSI
jgi:hypothetical protein